MLKRERVKQIAEKTSWQTYATKDSNNNDNEHFGWSKSVTVVKILKTNCSKRKARFADNFARPLLLVFGKHQKNSENICLKKCFLVDFIFNWERNRSEIKYQNTMEKRILLEKRGRDANQVRIVSVTDILRLFQCTAIKVASASLKSFRLGFFGLPCD